MLTYTPLLVDSNNASQGLQAASQIRPATAAEVALWASRRNRAGGPTISGPVLDSARSALREIAAGRSELKRLADEEEARARTERLRIADEAASATKSSLQDPNYTSWDKMYPCR